MEEWIYELIPKEKFITRSELRNLTNISDREIRRIISNIKQKHTIISLSSSKGYRKMINLEDATKLQMEKELEIIKHCIREINSRKKIYNKQLKQYIASLKVIEKKLENISH